MQSGRAAGILILSFVCAWAVSVPAGSTTYHVSPLGSNTPPYETYVSAAHHPSDAVNAASGYGDTVLVHAGEYEIPISTMLLPAGLTLAGVSRDSVRFIGIIPGPLPSWIVGLTGDNDISGLWIGGVGQLAVYLAIGDGYVRVHDCQLDRRGIVPHTRGAKEVFRNVFRLDGNSGCSGGIGTGLYHIYENLFYVAQAPDAGGSEGVLAVHEAPTLIEHNIFDFRISSRLLKYAS